MKDYLFSLLILLSFLLFSCRQKAKEKQHLPAEESNQHLIARTKTSFKTVTEIRFTEVYRRFDNGVSFNAQGYQLKPSWKLYFVSDTVVSLYSPIKQRYYIMPVTLDHDSIFSMAGAFFKTRKISKDSLYLQVLSVKNKIISWKQSNVYVTFFADGYIKNTLHSNAESLRRTTNKDTAYIQDLVKASDANPKKLFAAQEPVVLKSKSPSVVVAKAKLKAKDLDNYYVPETLFYPEYEITINKAYADFYHTFAVRVDAKGQLHFVEPMETMLDDQENTIKVMKGIMDGYLKLYLNITPGKTLGIAHDSLILLVVRGNKG